MFTMSEASNTGMGHEIATHCQQRSLDQKDRACAGRTDHNAKDTFQSMVTTLQHILHTILAHQLPQDDRDGSPATHRLPPCSATLLVARLFFYYTGEFINFGVMPAPAAASSAAAWRGLTRRSS